MNFKTKSILGFFQKKIKFFVSKKVLQNFFLVSGVTLITSILGFFKESIVASFYGLSLELDTFFVAILIPGVINTVFLGSFKSVFIPNYIIELNQKGNIGAFQSTSLVVTTVVSAIFIFIAFLLTDTFLEILYPNKSLEFYQMVKTQLYILLPAIFLWGMTSITGALLNVNDEYRLSSFSGIFTPISILLAIYFFNDSKSDTLLAWGTLLGAFLSFVYLVLIASKKKIIVLGKIHFNNENIKIAFKQIPAKISSGFLTAMNSVVDQFFAAQLLVGSIAALNYGLKIPAFASSLLLAAFSTVLLPYFSKTVINNRKLAFDNLFKNLNWLFLGLIIVTIIGILFSEYVVTLLFQRNEFTEQDTKIVSTIQKIFLAYIPFKITGMVMVNFATSINKNSIMAYIALIALILNIILDYVFMKFYGVFGIALCTTIVTFIKSLIMYFYLRKLREKIRVNVQ